MDSSATDCGVHNIVHTDRVEGQSIDSTKDRYSIVLFAYADYDAKIEIGGTHTSGEYVLSKLAATQDKGSVAVGRSK